MQRALTQGRVWAKPIERVAQTHTQGGSRILQGRVSNPSERGTGARALKAPRGGGVDLDELHNNSIGCAQTGPFSIEFSFKNVNLRFVCTMASTEAYGARRIDAIQRLSCLVDIRQHFNHQSIIYSP